jgi:2-polyprenyl-3-methyl-5-hydroxy-6-metoxy-1,4-benzoquinol methylase
VSKSLYSPFKLQLLTDFLRGKHILDLGAGTLGYSRWIVQHFSDVHVTAIDMIDQDSEQKITYLNADLEKPIAMGSASFSTIVAFDVIEHIANESLFVSEISRLLTSGGVLIGSVPHDADGFLPDYNVTFYHRSDLTHKRYYLTHRLQENLEQAGFIDIKILPAGGVPPHIFAEYFPSYLRWGVKKLIGFCVFLRILNDQRLKSDLFFVVRKP